MEDVVDMHLYREVNNQEIRKDYCEHCGRTGYAFETHHIKSKGSGGSDVRANKINLCVECHVKAQEYIIAPWNLIVRVAHREKVTVASVYAAIGWPVPDNIDELESMLNVPQPIFEPLENLVAMLVSSEETQTELEFFRGQVIDVMVHMGCTLSWIASNIGKSTGYVRQRLVTYRTFPKESDRAKDLSWTHHRIAALSASADKSADELLNEAVEKQYSTRQMSQAIQEQPKETSDERRAMAKKIIDDVGNMLGVNDDISVWLEDELRKLLDGVKSEVA